MFTTQQTVRTYVRYLSNLETVTLPVNGLLPYCVVVNIYRGLATCTRVDFQTGFVSLYRCLPSRGRYGTPLGSRPNLLETKALWVESPIILVFILAIRVCN